MCPSFQATRDERDSTRGRANLLRLAMTGQMGLSGFTDPQVRDVLDLCLECKACKSECPTNVDMARIKAEFLHQYHREHGVRFAIASSAISRRSAGSAVLAPVSSWMVQAGRAAGSMRGCSRSIAAACPPAFAGRPFVSRVVNRRKTSPEANADLF